MRISDWSSDVCASDLRQIAVAERLLRVKEAKDNLITFTEMTMPHPEDPDDPQRSRYEAQYFHRALAAALEEVEAGRMPRLIITFPPRHGKSELRSEEHTSELQSLMRISYAVFCLKKKTNYVRNQNAPATT